MTKRRAGVKTGLTLHLIVCKYISFPLTNKVRFLTNTEELNRTREAGPATTDLRAEERRSASRAQRHFSPASLSPSLPASPAARPAQRGQGRERRSSVNPAEQQKWRPPKWRPPARCEAEPGAEGPPPPPRGRRERYPALPRRTKGGARRLEARRSGRSRAAPAPRALRPPPKAARPRCGASAPRSASAAASAQAAARSALPAPAIILKSSSPLAQLPRAGAGRRRRPPRPRPWSAPAGAAEPVLFLRGNEDSGRLRALSNSRGGDTPVSSTQRSPHSTANPSGPHGSLGATAALGG